MRQVNSWLRMVNTPDGMRREPLNVHLLASNSRNCAPFQTTLERDFLLLLYWESENVDWYQSLPCEIEFTDHTGRNARYVPDLLIHYLPHPVNQQTQRPLLCEIEYREYLIQNRTACGEKFKAAATYAQAHGYQFNVLTERHIRTDYLKNIQFLWRYKYADFYLHHYEVLIDALNNMPSSTPNHLLDACYTSQTLRGEALWTLWCMVARKEIGCDLTPPLTMRTPIWKR